MELTVLMQCIATTFGVKVGESVRTEIASYLNLSNTDISAMSAKLATIQSLLDADPNTPEFDIAQNLITTLTSLTSRISALEGSTRVAAVEAAVAELTTALEAETARALAAEAAAAAQIAALTTSLQELTALVATVQENQAANCDCAAITDSIAQLNMRVLQLQGQGAAFESNIIGLQSEYVSIAAAVATAQATANAAATAAASASAAATANAAAIVALRASIDSNDEREHGHHIDHETKLAGKITRAEVASIDCVALGALFAAGIQAGLNPNGY